MRVDSTHGLGMVAQPDVEKGLVGEKLVVLWSN